MTAVLEHHQLGFPWTCLDPFLFTVHHLDLYPEGHDHQGPAPELLAGRPIGTDFTYQDGWSMYHGDKIPGFPQHPHRGFETVTVVRHGFVDHSDSLGATARYGEGDVQWLTTGSGIQHAEMFPLIHGDAPNTMELFQIWLNLPPESKMVPAYFAMLWSESIPTVAFDGGVTVDAIAGPLADHHSPAAPPDSWASRPESDLAIWLIKMPAGTTWTLPAASAGVNRMLYCFLGDGSVDDTDVQKEEAVRLDPKTPARLVAGGEQTEFLLLQGRPINAPVFQMGPFVMNTPEELQQAFTDYRATGFGGWPWSRPDPVHDREQGRFALHADGKVEHREMAPRLAMARFTRTELEALSHQTVPDLIEPGVKLLLVGINPGLWSAATGSHFARPGNRFYPALHRAGITEDRIDASEGMSAEDQAHLASRGVGITNIVERATARADELSAEELRAGRAMLAAKVAAHRPHVVAVLGITAYRTAFEQPKAVMGRQPIDLHSAEMWALPNPSGLNAHETVESLARWYRAAAEAAGIDL